MPAARVPSTACSTTATSSSTRPSATRSTSTPSPIPGGSGLDVGSLNALVIRRAGGPTTVKSTVPNQALASAPAAGSLAANPPAGAPTSRTAPVLAYAWTGGSATLNGVPLPLHDGLIEGAAPGSYTLVVDGVPVASATVTP